MDGEPIKRFKELLANTTARTRNVVRNFAMLNTAGMWSNRAVNEINKENF